MRWSESIEKMSLSFIFGEKMKPKPLKDKEKCIMGGKFHGLHIFLCEDVKNAVNWLLKEIEREESEISAQMIGYADTSKSYYELYGFREGLKFAKELIKRAFGEEK